MLLDEDRSLAALADAAQLKAWREQGVCVVAPPIYALLELVLMRR